MTQSQSGELVQSTCPGGWQIIETDPTTIAELVGLLQFDLGTFSSLLGTCIVLFIMGHSAGHVARNLNRV
ncbi:hypothetical protein [Gilvimarinus sp. DA14]|uniref:hypothetical protein n=1 Tax=Gilvimarinus sp. DA14 TaxID=2956798 RepID=UPI0020B79C94|nr:hypothetical protein [Gilvimarinus sp. DA14]UTF61282.1 hypothetical protein NHM04_05640 [Gilvimarinus sp. DA14]